MASFVQQVEPVDRFLDGLPDREYSVVSQESSLHKVSNRPDKDRSDTHGRLGRSKTPCSNAVVRVTLLRIDFAYLLLS
jgi:hypothetical protein